MTSSWKKPASNAPCIQFFIRLRISPTPVSWRTTGTCTETLKREYVQLDSLGQEKYLAVFACMENRSTCHSFLMKNIWPTSIFYAQVRAKQMNVTADVMARDCQSSAGYWEITQDALADLVRIMLERCFDPSYVELYENCRNLRGDVWLRAFPNFFCTFAPAEWTYPRPYFLEPYANCLFAGAYIMALHMYWLVFCIWKFLANRWGHRFFKVYE